jgi:tyrosine-protein kinase Etk/Wzc
MTTTHSCEEAPPIVAEERLIVSEHAATTDVSLVEVLTELARRKWLIAKITGVATLTGIIVSLVLPVRYTATTKLMPPQQTQSAAAMMMSQLMSAGGAGPLAAMAGAGLGLKNPNDIYVGMLNSRPVADAIIRKFNLKDVYRDKDMTATRKDLSEYTQVTSEKSGFLSVSVTDRDKKRAAAMANEYTEQLRALTQSIAVTEASQRRLFYERQLKEAKDGLLTAELAFEQVQQSKGVVQLDAQAKAMIESLTMLRAQIAAKEVELQGMRSYSTDQNPAVQITQRELVSLKDQAARLEQRSQSAGYTELGLRDVPSAGLDYLRAEHEVKYRQALFDLLVKQLDAARLDESKEAAIIQVVEPAIEPDRKSSPKRALITVFAIFAGLFAACIVAILQWWLELVKQDPGADLQLQSLKHALVARNPKAV